MAAITINERYVKLVRVDQPMAPAISGQALDAGVVVSQGTDSRYAPGGAGEVRGIVLETVLTANAPISVLKKGLVDLGGTVLASHNPGTIVYATDAGVLDDAATDNTRVGVVEAGRGSLDGDSAAQRRYLRVDL
jgi:hypothetical protein